ncbi:hypothetical protein BDN67DRAFT_1017733 [Paxillus ammoniavirescens]|nr:hypothetical protein BDN67DRAFT_1017733 [Paxillus ammoniavirescens]
MRVFRHSIHLLLLALHRSTDKATRITHIYARQIVGGIEVTDGHVNLNITDGRVLSFGDYFFPRNVPTRHAEAFVHPHANYHGQLSSTFFSHPRTICTHNCVNVPPFDSPGPADLDIDSWGPLLAFLASALPENHLELTSVLDNVDEHARKMVMTPETPPAR